MCMCSGQRAVQEGDRERETERDRKNGRELSTVSWGRGWLRVRVGLRVPLGVSVAVYAGIARAYFCTSVCESRSGIKESVTVSGCLWTGSWTRACVSVYLRVQEPLNPHVYRS